MSKYNKDIGNILGNVFDDEIRKQIKVRQAILAKRDKFTEDIVLYNSKKPWIRLISSVNVNGDGGKLAKENVLLGGTLLDGKNLRKGFKETYEYDDQLGYRPMPGIEKVSIKTLTRGSLKKAEVHLRAYTTDQLHTIDQLYMRPGYSVLLEWGHSHYLDSEGNLKEFNPTNTKPFEQIINPKSEAPYDLMFQKIREETNKHHGNYGAFYGRIVNFSYSFNNNVYSIRIELITMGDVIESLQIGRTSKGDFQEEDPMEEDERPSFIKYRDNTEFDNFLFEIWASSTGKIKKQGWFRFRRRRRTRAIRKSIKQIQEESLTNMGVSIKSWKYMETLGKKGARGEINPVYVRFGDLLEFLISNFNVFGNKDFHQLSVDVDEISNICRLYKKPQQGRGLNASTSFDPRICVVNTHSMGHIASDKMNEAGLKLFQRDESSGYIMNIYLNIGFLSETWNSLKNETGEIDNLHSFLTKVCDGINLALGNINKLRPFLVDDSKLVIIDEQELILSGLPPSATKSPSSFNLYGLGSFIYKPSFSVDLSKEFATMVTIGAQTYEPRDIVSQTIDSTSFSNYNKGLTDRIIPKKYLTPEDSKESLKERERDLRKKFVRLFADLYHNDSYTDEIMDSFTHVGRDYYQLMETKNILENKSRAPFFMPFKLNLQMDGLSGMRIYERFGVSRDSLRLLPEPYKNKDGSPKMEFLIESANEEISDKWVSEITGITIPVRK